MRKGLQKSSPGALKRYSPNLGLKQVAVYEAAEKYYARAKDVRQLEKAIRAKLTAQAEFVFWWDTKGPGSRHGGKVTDQLPCLSRARTGCLTR